MKKTFFSLSALLLSINSFAAEKLSFSEIPAVVQSKVEHLQFGELLRCYAYKGNKLYKFHFKDAQNEAEIKISSEGLLVEIESVIHLASLSKSQQEAVLDGGKRGELDKLEAVTGMFYEIKIMDLGVEKELKIDATGKVIKLETEEDDDKEESEDEDVDFSTAPKSVQDTIMSLAPKAPNKVEKEIESASRTLYEAEFTKYGQENEIKIGAHGELIEVEKVINISSLPSLVSKALKEHFPKAKLKKAELVKFYMLEAFFKKDGKLWEYKIHPDGALISSKEEK